MELRHLRYFVTVAEELHFGRAAIRLHMAQPPLSQQIRQLETEMGVRLFERNNRRVELTQAGEVFLRDVRAILEEVDGAVLRAKRASLGEWGWFGVGFVGSVTYDVLPGILRHFREQYPHVELVLLELLVDEQEQALLEHRIHVGFVRTPTHSEGIVLETLQHEPMMVALPASHSMTARQTIALPELANEPFVMFRQTTPSSYGTYIVQLCQEAGFTPHAVQTASEMQTALSLVSAGIGITLVPSTMQNFGREGVVYRPLAEPVPQIGLTLAYRENEPSPILPHFLRIAREATRN